LLLDFLHFLRRSLPMLSGLINERGSEEFRQIELRDREAVKPTFAESIFRNS
jgi:hypothetical protein